MIILILFDFDEIHIGVISSNLELFNGLTIISLASSIIVVDSKVRNGKELDFLPSINLVRNNINYVRGMTLRESNVVVIPSITVNFLACLLVRNIHLIVDVVVWL